MINGSPDPGRQVVAPMQDCWRHVGISGDRTCPELETFIHCRNCPVLTRAARTFFDRAAPAGYLESWRVLLEQPAAVAETDATSVLVFRLGNEWLALPTAALVEVTPTRAVHHVPHRTGTALEGLVNIRGHLQLCVSLRRLLGLEPSAGPAAGSPAPDPTTRLLVIERPGDRGAERWVFRVEEVAGVHRISKASMRAVPSTVSAAARRSTRALFDWQERAVGLLDDGWLMDGLRDLMKI